MCAGHQEESAFPLWPYRVDQVSLCGAHTQRAVGRRLAFLPPHTQKSRTGAAWDASCWEQSASCYGAGSIRSRDPRARRAVLCRRGRAPSGRSQALRAAGGHLPNRGRFAPRAEVRPHPVAQPPLAGMRCRSDPAQRSRQCVQWNQRQIFSLGAEHVQLWLPMR